MTDRKELETLQIKARKAGRTANFFFDEEDRLTDVFYRDPEGPGKQKDGLILPLVSFSEREREKKEWWQK